MSFPELSVSGVRVSETVTTASPTAEGAADLCSLTESLMGINSLTKKENQAASSVPRDGSSVLSVRV